MIHQPPKVEQLPVKYFFIGSSTIRSQGSRKEGHGDVEKLRDKLYEKGWSIPMN